MVAKSFYLLKLIDKIESVIKHMLWKAHFFMNGNVIKCDKESFGFKSKNCPARSIQERPTRYGKIHQIQKHK